MALYKGDKKLTLFRGDQKPYAIYKGDKQITGAVRSEKQAEGTITWQAPYKAQIPSVTVTGQGKQEKLTGKNLLPYPYVNTTKEMFGITFTDNKDGSVAIDGTATNNAVFILNTDLEFVSGKTYVLSPNKDQLGLSKDILILMINKEGAIQYIKATTPFTWQSNWKLVQIYLQVGKGLIISNLAIKPQLELGTVATPYEPYCGGIPAPNPEYPIEPEFLEEATVTDGTETANVPILRALPDGSVKDEVDLTTGVITRRIGELVLDGSENWEHYNVSGGTLSLFRLPIPLSQIVTGESVFTISQFYLGKSFQTRINNSVSSASTGGVDIIDNRYAQVEQFTQYLKDQYAKGTPVKVWYALKEPVTEQVDPQILNQHMGYTVLECNKPAELKATVFEEFEK